jgi:hypothetical protein
MATPQAISEFVPLLKAAQPSVYRNNAFRITGLDVDASPSEIARQIQKLEMMQRLGVDISDRGGAFSLNQRPTIETIHEARRRLNDPELRIVDEFFWFWPIRHGEDQARLWEPNSSNEDPAFQALRRDDVSAAIRIWKECQQNESDATATHNLAVLYHLQALEIELAPVLLDSRVERATELTAGKSVRTPDGDGCIVAVRADQVLVRLATSETNFYDRTQIVLSKKSDDAPRREPTALWSSATANWERLKSDHTFWQRLEHRIRLLDDPRVRPIAATSIRLSFPIALARIDVSLIVGAAESGNLAVATTHLARLRSYGLPASRVQELLEKGTSSLRNKVDELCKHTQSELSRNPEATPTILQKLVEDAKPAREILNYILGAGNPVRDSAQDQIATLIKESLPQYANTTKDFGVCRSLIKEARQLAASSYVQSLCQADLDTVNSLAADQISDFIVGICKGTEQAVVTNPQDGERLVRKFLADAEVLFKQLHEVTDPRSELRILAYDYVARTGRNCGVDFGNASQRWVVCQDLLQECRKLASSPELIHRIDEDIRVAQSNLLVSQTSINFTIPRPQPTQSYVPTASSARPAHSGAGKVIAVMVGIIVLFVLLKSCDTSRSETSGTRVSPSVSNSPATVSSETGTAASEAQNRIRVLKAAIESGRSQLRQFETSLGRCDQTLSNYGQLIENDRRQLDRMKSDNEAGLYVDKSEYERFRERHNSNVDAYNASLANCREIKDHYKNLLNTTNRKVDEYNHLISPR